MIFEKATFVSRIDRTTIWVDTQIKTSCQSCQHNSDCGTGLIAKTFTPKTNRVKALCEKDLVDGQSVILQISESNLVSGSVIMYGLPMVLMVTLAMVGQLLLLSDLAAIAGAAIGFTAGLYLANRLTRNRKALPVVADIDSVNTFTCVEEDK